jgi:CheY-like chemotaxis protein
MIMPGLDGFQVLGKFKSDAALRELAVIMLSALDEEGGIARCSEMGAEDYPAKPFSPILQADDKNLLSVRCLDSVFVVGRLAQRLARLVYTE